MSEKLNEQPYESKETGKKHSEYSSSHDWREWILEAIERAEKNPDLSPQEKRELIADLMVALRSVD